MVVRLTLLTPDPVQDLLNNPDDQVVLFSGLHVTAEMLAALGPREQVVFSLNPTVHAWPGPEVERVTLFDVDEQNLWRGECHARHLTLIEHTFRTGQAREMINFFKRHPNFASVTLSLQVDSTVHRLGNQIGQMKSVALHEMRLDFPLSAAEHIVLTDCTVTVMHMPRVVSLTMTDVHHVSHKRVRAAPESLKWTRVKGVRLADLLGPRTKTLHVVDEVDGKRKKFADLPPELPHLDLLVWNVKGFDKPATWIDAV